MAEQYNKFKRPVKSGGGGGGGGMLKNLLGGLITGTSTEFGGEAVAANPEFDPNVEGSKPFSPRKNAFNRNLAGQADIANTEYIIGKNNLAAQNKFELDKLSKQDEFLRNRENDRFSNNLAITQQEAANELGKMEIARQNAIAAGDQDLANKIAYEQNKVKLALDQKTSELKIEADAKRAKDAYDESTVAAALAQLDGVPIGDKLNEVKLLKAYYGTTVPTEGIRTVLQKYDAANAGIDLTRSSALGNQATANLTTEQARGLRDLNDRYAGQPRFGPDGKILYSGVGDAARILTQAPTVGKEILNGPDGKPISTKDINLGNRETVLNIPLSDEEKLNRLLANEADKPKEKPGTKPNANVPYSEIKNELKAGRLLGKSPAEPAYSAEAEKAKEVIAKRKKYVLDNQQGWSRWFPDEPYLKTPETGRWR